MKYNVITLVVFLLCLNPARAGSDLLEREAVNSFIENMVAKHGYDGAQLNALFGKVTLSGKIIAAISKPAEALPWYQYRAIFLKPDRIRSGVTFWHEHRAQLQRAERQYGVPVEVIIAIIGVETRYGRNTGGFKVLNALSTLAFDYPKRSPFFTRELEHYLLLTREQDIDPLTLKGSYAGAMGIPQFISSSYRAYAVDFDGDGVTDIWRNPTDAIGSVGNYFRKHGWRRGGDVIAPAIIAEKSDPSSLLTRSLEPQLTISELLRGGVTAEKVIDGEEDVKLLQLEGEQGHEYWLAFHNFYVITRYNHSALYAMAVYQLANEIKAHYQGDAAL